MDDPVPREVTARNPYFEPYNPQHNGTYSVPEDENE